MADLYLLLDADVPFVQDGIRDFADGGGRRRFRYGRIQRSRRIQYGRFQRAQRPMSSRSICFHSRVSLSHLKNLTVSTHSSSDRMYSVTASLPMRFE